MTPPLLVFIHVPRTAGTTLVHVLWDRFPDAVRSAGNVFKDPEKTRRRVLEVAAAPRERLRATQGHIPFSDRALFPPDTRYITFLREPLDRAVSHYSYLLKRGAEGGAPQGLPPLTGEVSLEECVEEGRYVPHDLHTKMLSDAQYPFPPASREMLEQAKANLRDRFAFVGITERFEESLRLLAPLLDLRDVSHERHRAGPVRPAVDELSPAARAALERANRFDLELYEFAMTLFKRALAGRSA